MKKRLTAGVVGLLMSAAVTQAVTIIDFEDNGDTYFTPSYQSSQSTAVTFYDSVTPGTPDGLLVLDLGSGQTDGRGIVVYGNDTSQLLMMFSSPINWLSMQFGADDPTRAPNGAYGHLTAYDASWNVLLNVSVQANMNYLMDQTIALSGVTFDRATFIYADQAGNTPVSLLEAVDNIQFGNGDDNPPRVPDGSSTILLMGCALFGVEVIRRKLHI